MMMKDEAERKMQSIHLRVTPEQKRLIEAAAEHEGLELSAWVRMVAVKAARRVMK
jgi:uncharacterized protein (DUF1778 family)